MIFRITALLLLLYCCPVYAQTTDVSGGPTITTVQPRTYNFATFSKMFEVPSAKEKALNKSTPNHPDLGYQYPQRPTGENIIEIISKRTETGKFFEDADTIGKIFSQSVAGPVHYKKDGYWLTYDARLQPRANGIFEAYKQAEPVGFDVSAGKSFIKTLAAGNIHFNNWKLYGVNASGEETFIASANWSTYTAGDDGLKVTGIFDGIDAEMVMARAGIKTSFWVNRSSSQWAAYRQLVFKDEMQGDTSLLWQFENGESSGEAVGNAWLINNGKEVLRAKEAIMYSPFKSGLYCGLKYKFDRQSLQMIIPVDSLQLMLGAGKVVIDPLVTGTSSIINYLNSGRFGTCTPNSPGCTYTGFVMIPAATQATTAYFHMPGWTTAAPFNNWSARNVGSVGCITVPFATVGTPDPNQQGGNTNPGTFTLGDPCIYPPSCNVTYVPWSTWLERSCTFPNAGVGAPAYAGCNANWVATSTDHLSSMTIEGRTLEYGSANSISVSPSNIVCQGQLVNVSAYLRYGVYTYNNTWSYSPTLNPVLSNDANLALTLNAPGIVRIYHRAVDQCGNEVRSFVDIDVRSAPAMNIGSNSPVCQGQTLNLTTTSAAPGFTYTWTGPSAFSSSLQNPSINNMQRPNAGTYQLRISGNGCSMTASTPVTVNAAPVAEATASPLSLCEGQPLQLQSTFRANDIKITEFTLGANQLGRTNPYPAFIPVGIRNGGYEMIELTNISNTAMPVGNLVIEMWKGTVRWINYTIPAAVVLPANSVMVLRAGAGTDNPAQFYFNMAGASEFIASNEPAGVILKNGVYVVDAVAVNSYVWPAASGVTAADWSGNIPSALGRAGVIRTVVSDNNTAADWEVSNTPAPLQTIGTNNPTVFVPSTVPPVLPFTYTWTGPNGYTAIVQNPVIPAATAAASGIYTVAVASGGCANNFNTATVTVNPGPSLLQPSDQSACNGTPVAAVTFTPTIAGTTFTWTNDNPSIGLAASGAGNIASFNGINPGNMPAIAHITVTPAGGTCPGVAKSYTITINPVAVIDPVTGQQLCGGTNTAPVNFTSNISSATYTWINDNPAIGLPASGSGNIPSFTAINNGATTAVAHITVTLAAPGYNCAGTTTNFNITVDPSPAITQPAAQSFCNGSNTTTINFTSNLNGTHYAWTNDHPEIGLAATGTGNIGPFIAANTGTAPIIATITVTPVTGSCPGVAKQFTITVNPSPEVNSIGNQAVCNGNATTQFAFSGSAGAVYNWTNSNPGIGLAASGTGDIPSFTAINPGSSVLTATIMVTPVFINGTQTCSGASKQFTITVNPSPTVATIAVQQLCSGSSATSVHFTGSIAGATYSWVNNHPEIGLAASGTGDISSFVAINSGTAPITATITVTPSSGSCPGIQNQFTITVNPSPEVNSIGNQAVCNGVPTTAVTFSGNVIGTVYSWTNSNPSIGLAAGGTGAIPSFTAVNTGTTPAVATITVTPVFTNGPSVCPGPAKQFTFTVNPAANVNTVANQAICNGSLSAEIAFSGTIGGTVFSWANNNPSIGLAASGTGNIPSFTAANNSSVPVTAIITVMPAAGTCGGVAKQFTITVNPTPAVNALNNTGGCNGFPITVAAFNGTVSGTTYSWTNNQPTIGLAATGTGNMPSFNGTNIGSAPIVATVTVTPYFTNAGVGCAGAVKTFDITVYPAPKLGDDKIVKICAGATANLNTVFTTTNLTAVWTNTQGSTIDPSFAGAGNYRVIASNATACRDTAFVEVQQYAAINLQVFSNPAATTIIEGQTLQLMSSGIGTLTYQWSPIAGLSSPQNASTIAVPPVSAKYLLTVFNEGQCKDTAGINITVLPLDVIPSGAFTPNNDGYTDFWIIKNLQYAKSSKVAVFNRWGNKVYEATNYQNNWDGKYKGQALPDGAYYYQLQVLTANGRTISKSGSITLVR